MSTKSFLQTALLGILAAGRLADAHTWVEQLMVISSNGSMVGEPGFARGNLLRSNPAFNDPAMVNLIPPDGRTINQILPSDLMCKSSQTSQTQTDGSPRLQAAAGSAVALRYQENGHVTLPQNQPGKPPNRGTVFVYGTTKPSPDDSFLAIHRVWNAQGTGGDGRGVLLSTQNFDDGQCYQVNSGTLSAQRQQQFPHTFDSVMGNDVWCQQDIALPASAPSGQPYTLYWVWDWPTLPGTAGFPDGKQEIYTSCMDVDIVNTGSEAAVANSGSINFVQGQDLNAAGIATELADVTNPNAVTGSSIDFGASATGPANGAASAASVSASAAVGESSVPAYISFHETSSAAPGAGTAVVPVQPLPQQTSQPQQSQGSNGGSGHGGHGFPHGGGNGAAPGATGTAISGQGPVAGLRVFTHTHSVFETVFQTVYTTQFDKRLAPATQTPLEIPSQTSSSCSRTESAYKLRARSLFHKFKHSHPPQPTSC